MTKMINIGILVFFTSFLNAQINAITETGDPVILNEDGTWKYLNVDAVESSIIPVNDNLFEKDELASFLVKSNVLNIGVWLNPKAWSFTKSIDDGAEEYQFNMKGEDLYAMLISEKIQLPLETLKNIALQNARNAAPDIKITKEDYRTVNGIKVLMLQLDGTIHGIQFYYFGYYYSNDNGTIQLLAYTSKNLFESYENDIEKFLNGLVELQI